MYVHIGKDKIIKSNNIILILNLEKIVKKKNSDIIFKEIKIEEKFLEKNKSLIILKEDNEIKTYFSNISSLTLAKRIQKDIL